jgi:TonB family protein
LDDFGPDELPDVLFPERSGWLPEDLSAPAIEGKVLLDVLVCASGYVADVRVTRSVPGLDSIAVTTVRQWIFDPAEVHGRPIPAWVVIPFHSPGSSANTESRN